MLNLIKMMSMRVEPPKPGTGRVHTLSNKSPVKNDLEAKETLKPNYNTESVRRRVSRVRRSVLQAISDGFCTGADIAAECDISRFTVKERCRELEAGKLIRKCKEGRIYIYRITGKGLLELGEGQV